MSRRKQLLSTVCLPTAVLFSGAALAADVNITAPGTFVISTGQSVLFQAGATTSSYAQVNGGVTIGSVEATAPGIGVLNLVGDGATVDGDVSNLFRTTISAIGNMAITGSVSNTGAFYSQAGTLTIGGNFSNSYVNFTSNRDGTLELNGLNNSVSTVLMTGSTGTVGTITLGTGSNTEFAGGIGGTAKLKQLNLNGASATTRGNVNVTDIRFGADGVLNHYGSNLNAIVSTVLDGQGTLALRQPATLTINNSVGSAGSQLKELIADGDVVLNSDVFVKETTVTAGHALTVGNGGATGSLSGNVDLAGRLIFNKSANVQFDGNVTGDGEIRKVGLNTLTLGGINNHAGTSIAQGTLVGNAQSIGRSIQNAGTVIVDQATDATYAGSIGGLSNSDGSMVKQGAGTLTLTGASSLDWDIIAGGLVADASIFTGDASVGTGTFLTFAGAGGTYSGTLSGNGQLNVGSDLYLTGDFSGFTGNTIVTGGTLSANGILGGQTTIAPGATLKGSGTIGTTALSNGAKLAPGNSIGTLNVAGDFTFSPGSTYEVEVDPVLLTSDRLQVGGTAYLNNANVVHVGFPGTYPSSSTYTILTAAGGINGTFGTVSSDLAYLDASLFYSSNSVEMTLDRKLAPTPPGPPLPPTPVILRFADLAETSNQIAVANAAEALGAGNPVFDSVLSLPSGAPPAAFEALSGEIHASFLSGLMEESHYLRGAVYDRLSSAHGRSGRGGLPSIWGETYGSWSDFDGSGNANSFSRKSSGFLAGGDWEMSDTWRLGFVTGYGYSSLSAPNLASSGSSNSYHLGVYGAGEWAGFGLRSGATYSWHDLHTRRAIAFPGFRENVTADYRGATAQVFGEIGYRFESEGASLEPFGGLAYVNVGRDSFSEVGGSAALFGDDESAHTAYSTVGLRAEQEFLLAEVPVTAHGMISWRHLFGDRTPESDFRFANGDIFSVTGGTIAEDIAALSVGLNFNINENAGLSISYEGQFGSNAREHTAAAKLSVNF
ncbi:outer membrane autotransporter protein [Pseudorhizobium tarimense]|uniref:Outer membrane autotransporter protein n=1 Tax=Pseudorhizobium tarimense TaxID=1079109 RepID=A0ABV2H613_9HYPH|nr:autotransporter domain-containing protein [Pseudorhizobium tarimense]MCJ8519166.1 autotransporter domain-containing protein [Pseudorhizobium tarimense]